MLTSYKSPTISQARWMNELRRALPRFLYVSRKGWRGWDRPEVKKLLIIRYLALVSSKTNKDNLPKIELTHILFNQIHLMRQDYFSYNIFLETTIDLYSNARANFKILKLNGELIKKNKLYLSISSPLVSVFHMQISTAKNDGGKVSRFVPHVSMTIIKQGPCTILYWSI